MNEAVERTKADVAAANGMVCDRSLQRINLEPFPHVFQEQFIEPVSYRRLCETFPICPPKIGPTGFSLYWGDEEYRQLLEAQPVWRELFNTFHSQRFIEWGREQFAEVWKREGCKINLSEARYVSYREDRIDKERAQLRQVIHEPQALWVRMDIHQGRIGYYRPVHLDHARRLISMLLYFSDKDENEMAGGELCLYSGKSSSLSPTTWIAPRHNLMVAFPCTPTSYHSVSAITAQRTPRNYVQVHISSSVDIWPRPVVPRWRRILTALKQQVKSSGS